MALLALGFATVLLFVGSSIGILVVGRVLQGISSAFTWTAGIALAVERVNEDEVGRTIAICSLGMNLALLIAPIVGGLLLNQGGYHSVFALAFGLLALDLVWRLAVIERGVAARGLDMRSTNIGPPDSGTTALHRSSRPRFELILTSSHSGSKATSK